MHSRIHLESIEKNTKSLFAIGTVKKIYIYNNDSFLVQQQFLHQIPILRADELNEIVGGDLHLIADLASAEVYLVAECGAFLHKSGE